MTAVLSAFSGHVPKAFVDKHPAAIAIDETVILLTLSLHRYWHTY